MTLTAILLAATMIFVLTTLSLLLALFVAIAEISERIDAIWGEMVDDEMWEL